MSVQVAGRSLKHQWLFLHSPDSITTIRRLVAFYVNEHNRVLPHSAFRGQTPDEMYFGTGDAVPTDLRSRAAAARRARGEANRSAACGTCRPSTRPRDQRAPTAVPTTGTPRVRAPGRETGEPTSHELLGRTASGIKVAAVSRPLRLNNENSRRKVQNVPADSSACCS